jgi:hypothetical protein
MDSGDNLTIASSYEGDIYMIDAAGRAANFIEWNLLAGTKNIGHTINRYCTEFFCLMASTMASTKLLT